MKGVFHKSDKKTVVEPVDVKEKRIEMLSGKKTEEIKPIVQEKVVEESKNEEPTVAKPKIWANKVKGFFKDKFSKKN